MSENNRRKVIQIAGTNDIIVALCDDGTIWKNWSGDAWHLVNTHVLENMPVPTDSLS